MDSPAPSDAWHWAFDGSYVLVSAIRLDGFFQFLLASLLTVGICLTERCANVVKLVQDLILSLDLSRTYGIDGGLRYSCEVRVGGLQVGGRQCTSGQHLYGLHTC